MNTKQATEKLKKHLTAVEKTFMLAVASVHAVQTERIFSKGEKDGGKIGSYDSTHPLYINPKKSPKSFTPRGKTGTKFKNGKPHKTKYFDSYKAFRGAVGRQTDHVDLVLTGQLQSDYRNSISGQKGLKIQVGVKNKKNVGKLRGAEKYGPVFNLTTNEQKLLIKVATDELVKECSKQ